MFMHKAVYILKITNKNTYSERIGNIKAN